MNNVTLTKSCIGRCANIKTKEYAEKHDVSGMAEIKDVWENDGQTYVSLHWVFEKLSGDKRVLDPQMYEQPLDHLQSEVECVCVFDADKDWINFRRNKSIEDAKKSMDLTAEEKAVVQLGDRIRAAQRVSDKVLTENQSDYQYE